MCRQIFATQHISKTWNQYKRKKIQIFERRKVHLPQKMCVIYVGLHSHIPNIVLLFLESENISSCPDES